MVALGTATASGSPIDPVAEWLSEMRPALVTAPASGSIVAMMRARTRVLDRMLAQVIDATPDATTLWSLGAGLDARWLRHDALRNRSLRCQEVDVPAVIFYKEQLLHSGPWSGSFSQVGRHALPERRWVDPVLTGPADAIVVMEAAPGRLSHEQLVEHLERLSLRPDRVQVLVEVPTNWSRNDLARMGWTVRADHVCAPRTPLLAESGLELCPAVRAFRLLWLSRS